MNITVLRHTSVAVSPDVCYGQYDVDLNSTFVNEANAYKKQLAASYDKVISSPLSRCTLLSDHIGHDYTTDARILEYSFGDWEMQKWKEIDQNALKNWASDYVNIPAPNGETLQQVYDRLANFMDELRSKELENVLLVAHGGIVRCLWTYVLQLPLKNSFKIPVGFGEILELQLTDKGDRIIRKQ